MNKADNTFAFVGIVGLGVHIVINLVALLLFKKESAEFFSEQWWSSWFPGFIVWFVFLIVGFANRIGGRDDGA